MKTLSMLNLKGGVGKTVSAVGLAKALADLGRGRVLLVDADPQGGLTRWVTNRVPDDFKTANLSSLVQGFTTVPGTLIDLDDTELHADDPSRAALWSGMSLIPTATTRIVVDAIFGGTIDYRALRDPLERDTPDDFAYCVVDVGHGDNDSTRIGVVASDLVITVIAGWQVQSVQQLSEVTATINQIHEAGLDHVELGGAIVTGHDEEYATHRNITDSIRTNLGDRLWSVIPWRADVERSINRNMPLTAMPSRIQPVPDRYGKLAERVAN